MKRALFSQDPKRLIQTLVGEFYLWDLFFFIDFFVCQEGKLPSECLKEGHCKALQTSFFECKRSMLDTRSRFRGKKGY
uniref:cytochrome c oxidase assembly factor 5-like n=1 Tax=Semicossyphus pulcher TaxID=241346 RepID=UPI0037E86202